MSKRAAIYSRVSTRDQQPEAQADPLRRYVEARGWTLAGEYVDHGVSGAKASRPGLDAMMAAARKREVDVVVAVKLDRLGRSTRHLLDLAAELSDMGLDLCLTEQGIDTSTPAGRMTFTVLGAIAEFERELLRERTVAGLDHARRHGTRSGKTIGRQPVMVGETLARGRRLKAAGKNRAEIAQILGVSWSSVDRALWRSDSGA